MASFDVKDSAFERYLHSMSGNLDAAAAMCFVAGFNRKMWMKFAGSVWDYQQKLAEAKEE